MMDGGIRHGTDAIKALALGAKCVYAARPMLFGAAVAGEAGVRHAIAILRQEIDRSLALLEAPSQSIFAPTSLTSFPYLAYSLRSSAANSSGVAIQGSTPPAMRSFSLASGSTSALFTSARSLVSVGSGVRAGANNPYHVTITKSG